MNQEQLTSNNLPIYLLLTGIDAESFCYRVSEAINLGYTLYGSSSITFKVKQYCLSGFNL